MAITLCGAEGEWALFENTLDPLGNDGKRRGSVQINIGEQMFKDVGAAADRWFNVRLGGEGYRSTPIVFLQIRDTNGNLIAGLEPGNGSAGAGSWFIRTVVADSPGAATTTSGSENFPISVGEFQDWTIHVKVSTVSSTDDTLTVSFYRNGQLRQETTIVDAGGWAHPAQLLLREKDASNVGNRDRMYYQDVIITDGTPTVGMELAVLVPSAVGNYNDFDNDYTNIDDNGYDPSTVISTAATNQRESWVFAAPGFSVGNKVIYAVAMDTVAQLDLGGVVSDFQPFLRIGGTDFAGASLGANNTAPDSYTVSFTNNPSTGNPWTESDLAGLEAGILSQ